MSILSKFKMPSNLSSRSSSVNSLASLNLDDVFDNNEPEPVEESPPEIDIETTMPTDSEAMPDFYKNFTLSHPLGNLLIRLTSLNEELCKKNNMKAHDLPPLSEVCRSFTTAIKLERNKLANKVSKATTNLEDTILSKELNFHNINTPVKPPTTFSQVPVITTSAKMAEVIKTFPCKSSQRFTGSSNGVNIIEFLNSMNISQTIMNLSKPEFLQILLKCTSGKVYSLVAECISYEHDIDDIYHSLLTLYDNRISSSNARRLLMSYKAPKSATLTKVQSHILELASRIASQLPVGKSRTSMFNIEATNALVRSLPHYSSTLVTNVMNTLAAKLMRHPTFIELTKALTKYADSINTDLLRNGALNVGRRESYYEYTAKPKPKVYAINRTGKPNSNMRNNPTRNYRPQREQTRTRNNRVNSMKGNRYGDSPKNEKVYNMNTQGNTHRQERYFKGLYCSLCGGNNHSASQICYRMKDSTGRVVETVPTYYHCELCFKVLKKKLYHPENVCFSKKQTEDDKA